MTEEYDYDLVVVGGGPAGSSAAFAAAKNGIKVALIEKENSIAETVRTSGVTWIKSIKEFEIPDNCYHPIKNFSFASPNNEVTISDSIPTAAVLDVRKTYRWLSEEAKKLGVDIFVKTNINDVIKDEEQNIIGIKGTRSEEKITFNDGVLPSVDIFHIDPSFIGEIIGQAGKTIREMIEKFEVAIDIDKKDGKVKITGKNKAGVADAKNHIHGIINTPKVAKIKYKVGDKYEGTVKRIVDFGAFVELPDGTDGLLHISKISDKRVEKVSDVLSEGEKISVEILEFKGNKISLGRV